MSSIFTSKFGNIAYNVVGVVSAAAFGGAVGLAGAEFLTRASYTEIKIGDVRREIIYLKRRVEILETIKQKQ